jgi:hypothetical protein
LDTKINGLNKHRLEINKENPKLIVNVIINKINVVTTTDLE